MKTVTRGAIVKRINRRIRKTDNWTLRKQRGNRWPDLGQHYLVDLISNSVIAVDVDPVELAREYGLLRPFERCDE